MPRLSFLLTIIFISALLTGCSPAVSADQQITGEVVDGYRIMPIPKTSDNIQLRVYRGDYIKFKLDQSMQDSVLSIPELSITKELSGSIEDAPFFKMKKAGTFAFTLGEVKGTITVDDYRQSNYREVTAQQAADFIDSDQPFILDVRTPREYEAGHLKDAVLIPVQVLEKRLNELSDYKDQEVLVYCATGNRSTVASKILIDNGFTRVTNMRYGIADWGAKNHPVVR